MDRKLSSQQLYLMVFLLLFGSALVFLIGKEASQNAWLSALIGSFLGAYVLWAIVKIHALFPGQRITQVSYAVLGRVAGTILNGLFLWATFAILCTFLFDIIMLLEIIYSLLPRVVLYPLLMLPCCYILYKGLTVLGRLGEIIIVPTIIIAGLGIALSLPLVDLANLKPFGENWRTIAAGALYAADWPFAEVVILGLFLPLVSGHKINKTPFFLWYFASVIMLILIDINIITVLGWDLANLSVFPLFATSRVIGLENFQRMELLFFVIWFITGIYTILLYFQGLTYIVQDFFSLKNYKALILPLGLCVVVFTLYMFPNTIEYSLLGFKYLEVYTLPVNLLYPTIILCATQYRQKRPPRSPVPPKPLQHNNF